MLVAAGQFAVTSVWEKNAEICASLMAQAAENDVSLFVLPEALLARDDHDADAGRRIPRSFTARK